MASESTNSETQQQAVTSTTRSLLLGLKDQDAEAWNRMVQLYTPLVYYWCQKHGLKTDDIPDVVQEVFKSVAVHISRFRKERAQDTFRGWLRVITRNKAMDVHRRFHREAHGEGGSEALQRLEAIPAPESVEAGHAEDAQAESILFHQALELIRSEFREPTWKAFWRVVVDGRAPADVAQEMKLTPGAVRVAKCRVLQRLRLELGELPE